MTAVLNFIKNSIIVTVLMVLTFVCGVLFTAQEFRDREEAKVDRFMNLLVESCRVHQSFQVSDETFYCISEETLERRLQQQRDDREPKPGEYDL